MTSCFFASRSCFKHFSRTSSHEKQKKHEVIVEGQRLRKANIMEGNAFFLEKMSKQSVESLGDTDVQNRSSHSAQLVSLRVAEVEQLYQVKRMIGGIVNKTREDEREKKRERERENGRKREERERPSVCAFKTPACVRSKRPRVYRHHAHMLKSMCAWCRYTRRRFECTRGCFSAWTHHNTQQHHNTNQQHTTSQQHKPHTTTHHNNTPHHINTNQTQTKHTTTHHHHTTPTTHNTTTTHHITATQATHNNKPQQHKKTPKKKKKTKQKKEKKKTKQKKEKKKRRSGDRAQEVLSQQRPLGGCNMYLCRGQRYLGMPTQGNCGWAHDCARGPRWTAGLQDPCTHTQDDGIVPEGLSAGVVTLMDGLVIAVVRAFDVEPRSERP